MALRANGVPRQANVVFCFCDDMLNVEDDGVVDFERFDGGGDSFPCLRMGYPESRRKYRFSPFQTYTGPLCITLQQMPQALCVISFWHLQEVGMVVFAPEMKDKIISLFARRMRWCFSASSICLWAVVWTDRRVQGLWVKLFDWWTCFQP